VSRDENLFEDSKNQNSAIRMSADGFSQFLAVFCEENSK
jgi:hypothetical protein